ncbi:PaaI family thioesterase [Litorivivens sp.]|uniref:PaaI family thioesterase n=1 Tax=Litorivivens sp. TaxID=2020868 RepID=UPI0035649D0A
MADMPAGSDNSSGRRMLEDLHNPFLPLESRTPATPHWEAKREMAQAMRDFAEAMMTSTPSPEQMREMTQWLQTATEQLTQAPRVYGRNGYVEASEGTFSEVFQEVGPLCGHSNPIAPPLEMWAEGDTAYARVTMGWRYEGPPGCVHGGFVAALFDEFLGMAQFMGGHPGMTGTLTIKYRRPTPLNMALKLSAWIDRAEGRKTFARGKIEAGGIVTAECEGIFIRPNQPVTELLDAVTQG